MLFNLLSQQEIEMIDAASRDVIKKIGIRVEDPVIRDKLSEIGCLVEGERVKASGDIIQDALKNAKNSIVFAREDSAPLQIEPGNTYCHSFGATAYILDSETGKKRKATTRDQVNALKVMNKLDCYNKVGAMLYPADIEPEISQIVMTESLLKYSKKPFSSPGLSTPQEAKYVVELFKTHASQGNFIGSIAISPESPLFYPKTITDIMRIVITEGIPTIALICPIVGLTAPMTIAGGLVQMNASFLFFNVLATLFNATTPIIYGARLSFANMKTAHSIYGLPEVGIAGASSAQLAHHYGFISDVYGLSCNSCTFDNQAGYEKAINGLLPVLANANFISGLGGLASSTLASLEQLVIDCETFKYLLRVARGFTVDNETLAIKIIDDVANGGNYLEQEHTIKYLHGNEVMLPTLGLANLWHDWAKDGMKTVKEKAHDLVNEITNDKEDTFISSELEKETTRIIKRAKEELTTRKRRG